jgi:hypothetical protein
MPVPPARMGFPEITKPQLAAYAIAVSGSMSLNAFPGCENNHGKSASIMATSAENRLKRIVQRQRNLSPSV